MHDYFFLPAHIELKSFVSNFELILLHDKDNNKGCSIVVVFDIQNKKKRIEKNQVVERKRM